MTAKALENMTRAIRVAAPPAALQGFRVVRVTDDSLTLSAPLEHTWNGAGIGFAGSLATLCAFTGASLCSQACRDAGFQRANAFCHTASIKYGTKVADEVFAATATFKDKGDFERFKAEMRSVGKARLTAAVRVVSGGKTCVEFEGDWTCNDSARSKRGNVRYSQYDRRAPQGGAARL